MSVLYNTNMAIKECLKRAQDYQMEGCGLECHGLLVFKQCLVSIKVAFTSATSVHGSSDSNLMIDASKTFNTAFTPMRTISAHKEHLSFHLQIQKYAGAE